MTGVKLTVYVGERDRAADGTLAASALGDLFARGGVRLAVLLRGIEGFGLKHTLQTHRMLSLSEDLPLVWVAVDTPEVITALAERVDALLPAGLVTLERAQVAARGADLRPSGDAAAKLTVYCGRGDRAGGRLAHHAVVDHLRAHGVQGASVLLGVDGVTAGTRRRPRFIGRNAATPVMVVAVGAAGAIEAALPGLDPLLGDAVVTLERVRLLKRDGRAIAPLETVPDTDGAGRGLWQKVMVFTGEDAEAPGGGSLYVELIRALRAAGATGATVMGGIWGYSGSGPAHGDHFLSLRRRVPVVCVSIERPARLAELWPVIDRMTANGGLVTGELVPAFRAAGPGARVGGVLLAEPPG